MRYSLRYITIHILLLFFICIRHWPSIFNEIVHNPIFQRDWVCNGRILFLINSVKYFKAFSADQLIITINKESNLIRLAIFGNSHINIWYSGHLLLIYNNSHLILANIQLFQISFNHKSCVIIRCIINDYNMIIWIVLIEYTLQIKLKSIIFSIIIWRDDNTKG